MSARALAAGRRISRGTWHLIEAYGDWLGGQSHRPARVGLRSGAVWLGVVLARLVASLFALVFYGAVVQRAPYLIYVLPLAWAYNAWHMSDSSATPPPQERHPSCHKCAGQEPLSVTPSESQKGMLIYAYELPKRPGHTHLHITKTVNDQ
ncbi:hypothetical protein [Streptomyces sp. NPDC004685]